VEKAIIPIEHQNHVLHLNKLRSLQYLKMLEINTYFTEIDIPLFSFRSSGSSWFRRIEMEINSY